MSIHSVGYSSADNVRGLLLQQLLGGEDASGTSDGLSGLLDDLVSISSTGQQLSQAPEEVLAAMNDLFSTKTDVQGDIVTLQAYFQENPDGMASLLGTLQGSSGTYDALGNLASGSSEASLMSTLLGVQSQNSLLDYLGSAAGSSSSSISLLG